MQHSSMFQVVTGDYLVFAGYLRQAIMSLLAGDRDNALAALEEADMYVCSDDDFTAGNLRWLFIDCFVNAQ